MRLVRCPNCGFVCKRNGKTNAGSQRWYCNQCSCSFTNKVNKTNNNLQIFLDWLFGKHTQLDMSGELQGPFLSNGYNPSLLLSRPEIFRHKTKFNISIRHNEAIELKIDV